MKWILLGVAALFILSYVRADRKPFDHAAYNAAIAQQVQDEKKRATLDRARKALDVTLGQVALECSKRGERC
jgi:hypothetical protein